MVFVVALAVAAPVVAQDRQIQIGGGMATTSFQGDYGRWHTYVGWSADVSWPLSRVISIAGELGRTASSTDYGRGTSESDASLTFDAGPRFSTPGDRPAIGFAQVLVGGERNSFTLRTPPFPDYNGAGSVLVLDMGGGVQIALSQRIAVRGVVSAAISNPWYALLWQVPEWKVRISGVYRLGAR